MSKKLEKRKAKLERRRSRHGQVKQDRATGYRQPGSMNPRKQG